MIFTSYSHPQASGWLVSFSNMLYYKWPCIGYFQAEAFTWCWVADWWPWWISCHSSWLYFIVIRSTKSYYIYIYWWILWFMNVYGVSARFFACIQYHRIPVDWWIICPGVAAYFATSDPSLARRFQNFPFVARVPRLPWQDDAANVVNITGVQSWLQLTNPFSMLCIFRRYTKHMHKRLNHNNNSLFVAGYPLVN